MGCLRRESWLPIGSFLLGLGVLLGAIGSHVLREQLDAYSIEVFKTGVAYQMLHGVGIMLVAILQAIGLLPVGMAGAICALFAAGVGFFSISLYLLAVTGVKAFGAIPPVGGVLFLAGWFLLTYRLLWPKKGDQTSRS